MLDPEYKDLVPFTSLFKKISIQVDRKGKFETITDTYEWIKSSSNNISNDNNDSMAVAFQVLIPNSDNGKPFTARISMERVFNTLVPRFEVSDKLLALFPNILLLQNRSVTEEEIMFYLWTYIQEHNLLEGRRMVRCDPALCVLFNLDVAGTSAAAAATAGAGLGSAGTIGQVTGTAVTGQTIIPMHTLKQRLFDEQLGLLIPAAPPSDGNNSNNINSSFPSISTAALNPVPTEAPAVTTGSVPTEPLEHAVVEAVGSGKINVEYYLTSHYNTSIDVTKDGSCCPVTVSKSGGKCFDLEVYLPPSSLLSSASAFVGNALTHLNNTVADDMARSIHLKLDQYYQRCVYMSKKLNELNQQQIRLQRQRKQELLERTMKQHKRSVTVGSSGINTVSVVPQLSSEYVSSSGNGLLGLRPRTSSSRNGLTDHTLVRYMHATTMTNSLTPSAGGNPSSILHSIPEYFDVNNDNQFLSLLADKECEEAVL